MLSFLPLPEFLVALQTRKMKSIYLNYSQLGQMDETDLTANHSFPGMLSAIVYWLEGAMNPFQYPKTPPNSL